MDTSTGHFTTIYEYISSFLEAVRHQLQALRTTNCSVSGAGKPREETGISALACVVDTTHQGFAAVEGGPCSSMLYCIRR